MQEINGFNYSARVLLVPLFLVLLIWSVYWAELSFGWNLNHWGIAPRTLKGLRGIVFSPFIHGSLKHLYNNTIPLAVLTAMLFYFYNSKAWKVLLWGLFLSGLITWGIGRPSYHIGASGLIYVLASFIFFKGIFTKYYRLVALSLIVVFLYGSLLWYIFPVKEGMSWEGHLAGFLVGIVLALATANPVVSAKKYAWEKEGYNEENDPFLKHFDEQGNFVERLPEEPTDQEEPITIRYVYREKRSRPNGKDGS
ncbi:rhomboid family intramembrane serine protease [Maribacter sp. 2307ULW6-5]|uniref:rhomboid family intramembrane serine protease n=1 Tax=Maribacter sp. 2307ULW6-5 TaxID=3386275 RepID=UPI0039BCDDFF